MLEIAAKAPWLSENEGPLFPLTVHTAPEHIIEELILTGATIINDKGLVYKGAKLSKGDNYRVKISMPPGWDDSASSFHVVFRNREGQWNSFLATNISEDHSDISIIVPENIFHWQKRRYNRVMAPPGTRAIFRDTDKSLRTMNIRDLSIGGVLAYRSSSNNKFLVGTPVDEVLVYIDQRYGDGRETYPRKILPIIDHAQIARSFIERTTSITYYGISFELISDYVADNYRHLVEDIEHGIYV